MLKVEPEICKNLFPLCVTAKIGTPEVDRLDVLATLVAGYEARNFPIEVAAPFDVTNFALDRKGHTVRDLHTES